ncbi:tetratricopeptide repeat protein [Lunatibacter salilacus]|uniref:tetratricopeptide repeat protein n=1 Tax=Lunatibacter salilacus TaxID=2483804 RepID=UPI00131B1917|nr:tetratricopeptide repeat protein [Lunatibacter salilacus]
MKSNKELLIEGYFENSLSPLEQNEFERLLKEDAEFAEAVAFHKKLKAAIRLEEREKLKAQLDSVDKPPKPIYRWWYAAAAVVLIVTMGWWISSQNHDQPEDLYFAYFEPYPNRVKPTVRSNNDQNGHASQAFHLYDQEQFDKAATAFEEVYKKTDQDYALFYQAISYMASGNPEKAIPLLEQHEWEPENPYYEASHWYMALAYLNDQQIPQTKSHLKKVIDSNGLLSGRARKLLEEMGD